MKVEAAVLGGVGLILAPWAIVYLATSDEPAGEAALVLAVVALLFVAVYLGVRARSIDPRPEDDPEGRPVAGDDLGFYPGSSVWPITLALATTIIAFGIAFSGWVSLPGLALFVVAVTGYAVEAQRSRGPG